MNKNGRPHKYVMTDESMQAMLDRYDSSTKVISELSTEFSVPRDIIKDWAKRLNIQHYTWTDLDVAYLKRYIHKKTLTEIADHLGRTRNAVQNKAARMGLIRPDGYTMREINQGLGTYDKNVHQWMSYGWIIGTRRGPDAREWNFSDTAIKRFLQEHPEEVSEEVMQSLWVQDILSDYGLGELVSVR